MIKAICDRNGWLLGTPDERHHRELVERTLPDVMTSEIRTRLAHGDTATLAYALHQAPPTDTDLDARTWRWNPGRHRRLQVRQLLGEASREAHVRFADWHITAHPSRAVAFLARFPDRIIRRGLTVHPEPPTPSAPLRPTPEPPPAASPPAAPPLPELSAWPGPPLPSP
ncbi:hypothetical protein ND747_24765 [Frankia sp. R82]|nr:hypothetical protein [Frankia sp. R82]